MRNVKEIGSKGEARGGWMKCRLIPFLTLGNPKWARITNSFPPGNCLIFHTKAFFSGT